MMKRADITDEKMLDDLRVIASFDCKHWKCMSCPLFTLDGDIGCISIEVKHMLEKYDDGEEVIY